MRINFHLYFLIIKMSSYPKYNLMSYPNENTYPQSKSALYLGVNTTVPCLGNTQRPHQHEPSLSESLLAGVVDMTGPGQIVKRKYNCDGVMNPEYPNPRSDFPGPDFNSIHSGIPGNLVPKCPVNRPRKGCLGGVCLSGKKKGNLTTSPKCYQGVCMQSQAGSCPPKQARCFTKHGKKPRCMLPITQ